VKKLLSRSKFSAPAALGAALCVLVTLFAGCANPLAAPPAPIAAATGNVTINFAAGAARTVFPARLFDNYSYSFAKSGGGAQEMTPGPDGKFTLETGQWTVEVKAYAGAAVEANLAATGAAQFTVHHGVETPVTVFLAGRTESGSGAFTYRIKYPATAELTGIAMEKLPDFNTASAVDLGNPTQTSASGATVIAKTAAAVPAGFYLVSVRLAMGELTAGRTEVAHIYNNLTTEFGTVESPVIFAAADFVYSGAPHAPTAPTVIAADRQLAISWAAVTGATAYEVWRGTTDNTGSAEKYGDDTTDTAATIAGLANGTSYYVWVKAKNSAGTSGFSPSSSGTPILLPPGAPAAPAITPRDRQLAISWAAVTGATAYEVWRGTTNNTGSAEKYGDDVAGNTTTIAELDNGTSYYVWVKAKNSAGTSGFSPSASGVPIPPPSAPSAPSIIAGDRQLAISWAAVTGATAYEVWLGTTGSTESALQSGGDVTGNTKTIADLVGGTSYYVWVKAKNSAGTSGFSPSANGVPVSPPSAPAAPAITPGNRQLAVSWAAVTGATAYEVWLGTTDNTGDAQKSGDDVTGNTTTIAGLVNGTTYYVWVKAKNNVGPGAFSPSANGTPISPLPAAPVKPTVTAGNGRLEVSWTAVEDATAYEVWHGTSNNTESAQQFGDDVAGAATVTIDGFDKYIKHYVWVKAKNSAGTSGFSPPASGIPLGLDPRIVGVWQFIYGGQVMEECTITTTTATVDGAPSLGTMEFGGPGYGSGSPETFNDVFSGDILWAEAFDDEDVLAQQMYFIPSSGRWDVVSAGVIIIKYWPGHEHGMWTPTGNYYGIYYMNLKDDGTQVAIFHTSNQANGYGPTETTSLESAKARFTIENIKLWLSTAAGDPQIKVDPEDALPRQ
jgi:DMSO/TMAO reductase YedYZ heme-binding membrane subunit